MSTPLPTIPYKQDNTGGKETTRAINKIRINNLPLPHSAHIFLETIH